MDVIISFATPQNDLYHDSFHPFGSKLSLKLRQLLNIQRELIQIYMRVRPRLLVGDLIKLWNAKRLNRH